MSDILDTTISHYKIIEKLGEGGMGEVYKALDTKLDRFVALKFLPAQFSSTEDEKKRFIKEAKTASSLNHSNICTIYDIQEYENQKGERQTFIIMEYVEGKTLKDIKSELPVKEIIDIGIQIAEGLAAAHEKGIIHRDIKPENIMIRKSGRVQIMDFGLAKLYSTSEVSRLTKIGSTMGTLSFMSPEQVQGLDVDYRSDIFSAGVVLYELLSGESPFKGIHDAAIIYKIVNVDVLPVSSIRKNIDPLLDLIILKCLEKDKEKRYQSSKELAEDLGNIKQIYEEDIKHVDKAKRKLFLKLKSRHRTSISPSGSIRVERRAILFSKKLLWVILIVIGIISAVVYYSFFSTQLPQLNPDMKFREIDLPFTQLSHPSISYDGNWIAYAAADQFNKWDIYIMNTNYGEPLRITHDSTSEIQIVDISPDGSQICYSSDFNIYIVSSLGGVRRKIIDNGIWCLWTPDGKRIGFIRDENPKNAFHSLWSIKPDGKDLRLEYADTLDGSSSGYGSYGFSYSLDGKSIAWIRNIKQSEFQEFLTINLKTDEEKKIIYSNKHVDDVCWTRRGVILFVSNMGGYNNVWMINENGGTPVQLTKGNGSDFGVCIPALDNKILYYQFKIIGQIWIKNIETSETKEITFNERIVRFPSFSPDKKKIVFTVIVPIPGGTEIQLFVMDYIGNTRTQIVSSRDKILRPIFSPQGNKIAYTRETHKGDLDEVYIVNPENPRKPEYVCDGIVEAWLDEKNLLVRKKTFNVSVSIDNKVEKQIYLDSTFARPVANGEFIVFSDLRKNGIYLTSAQLESSLYRIPLLISHDLSDKIAVDWTQDNYFYWQNKEYEIRRFSYKNFKEEKVGVFPNLSSYMFNASNDNKEIVYADYQSNDKFVMIEDVFIEN